MNNVDKFLISNENIVLAIKLALGDEHEKILTKEYEYLDFSDDKAVNKTIETVKDIIKKLINDECYFLDTFLYLKPKGIENGVMKYRPLYVYSSFNNLVAQYALLNVLVYDFKENENDESNISINKVAQTIPSYFYGNAVQISSASMYIPWYIQYAKYSNEYFKIYEEKKDNCKYEINIDLENFFPSINLCYLNNYLSNLYKTAYGIDDYSKIIRKSLIVNVKSGEDESINKDIDVYNKYLLSFPSSKRKDNMGKKYYNKGLPQGLPQSKFFSNLLSTIIDDEYKKMFYGEMLFYVDDVIIFTNDENRIINNDNSENTSKLSTREIFNNINDKFKSFNTNDGFLHKLYSNFDGEIKPNKNKTNYIEIESNKRYEYVNNFFAKKVSNASFLYNTYFINDNKDPLFSQMYFYYNVLSNEIRKSTEKKEDLLVNKLKRYKKFYKNRSYNLADKIKSVEFSNFVEKEIENMSNNKNLLEYINDDCVLVLLKLIDESSMSIDSKNTYKNKIEKIFEDNDLLKVKYYNEYIKSDYTNLEKELLFDKTYQFVYKYLSSYKHVTNEKKEKFITKIFNVNFENTNYQIIYDILSIITQNESDLKNDLKKYEYVINNDLYFVKKILNMCLSIVLNVPYSFSVPTLTNDGIYLLEYQYRILFFVRSKSFDLKKTSKIIRQEILPEVKYKMQIDDDILMVIPYFEKNINSIEKINCLMDVHNYVKGIWSNGSKFLFFYTLHNHTHAIELINSIEKIKDRIEVFSLSKDEYYYLYLACYLHDISMVIDNNNINTIFLEECEEQIKLIEGLKADAKNFENDDNYTIKKNLFEYFKKIDSMIENKIRGRHAINSASYILATDKLKLTNYEKDIVAKISNAHGSNAEEIYFKEFSEKNIDVKKLCIMLRLVDLLDMSKNRISEEFLKMIESEMPIISQFHYLSHEVVNGFEIYKNYTENANDEYENELKKYKEILYFVIQLNTNAIVANPICKKVVDKYRKMMKVEKKCLEIKDYFEENIIEFSSNEKGIIISINAKEQRNDCKKCNSCSFMCEWLNYKNEYLINELFYLKDYLSNSFFNKNQYVAMQVDFKIFYDFDNTKNDNEIVMNMKKIMDELKK